MQNGLHTDATHLTAATLACRACDARGMDSFSWLLRQICLLVVIVAERAKEFSLWLGQELVQHGTVPQKLAAAHGNGSSTCSKHAFRQRCSSSSAQIMPTTEKIGQQHAMRQEYTIQKRPPATRIDPPLLRQRFASERAQR